MEDRLHQPYRAPLVPGLSDVLAAARGAGVCGAALSGSGPTTVAFCEKGPHAERIGAAMTAEFRKHGIESRHLVLPVDRDGVQISK